MPITTTWQVRELLRRVLSEPSRVSIDVTVDTLPDKFRQSIPSGMLFETIVTGVCASCAPAMSAVGTLCTNVVSPGMT